MTDGWRLLTRATLVAAGTLPIGPLKRRARLRRRALPLVTIIYMQPLTSIARDESMLRHLEFDRQGPPRKFLLGLVGLALISLPPSRSTFNPAPSRFFI